MSKRIMCFGVGFVLLLGAASNVFGEVYNYWRPASGDWSVAANWSLNTVPSQPNANPHYAIVNSGVAITTTNGGADRLQISANADGLQPCTVNVGAGLDLHVQFELIFGGMNDGNGILNLGKNATAYSEHLIVGQVAGGTGTINVGDGATLTTGWWGCEVGVAGTGTINLGNGNMVIYGSNPQPCALTIGDGGHIDITGGEIKQSDPTGAFTAILQAYAAAGKITGYGGPGTVNVFWDPIGTGWTRVTAIPEPMTMAMIPLGLGSLLIRKRLS